MYTPNFKCLSSLAHQSLPLQISKTINPVSSTFLLLGKLSYHWSDHGAHFLYCTSFQDHVSSQSIIQFPNIMVPYIFFYFMVLLKERGISCTSYSVIFQCWSHFQMDILNKVSIIFLYFLIVKLEHIKML
jgi:hypothetical protein